MTTTQTTTKTSPRGLGTSSMFSKLANTFASKPNPQIRHEIELDEPFKHFVPGEQVKGAVHLEAAKPFRATHLVVRLHGLVKVISHSKLPGEPIPYDEHLLNSTKGPGRGRQRGGEYFGNGFARLFEEEVVLCGDGRLSGNYEFRFELRLPSVGLPSSIDFENGTITYLLTSILTRPTTISPMLTKDCKLKVKEKIDIAPIPLPRPQSISLETVKRRRPAMMKRKLSAPLAFKESAVASRDEIRESTCTEPSSAVDAPNSPAPSELSSTSITSSSTSNTHNGNVPQMTHEARSPASGSISFAASDKTITAQTEVLQGGCLPGDLLPIKVSIDHTKAIKSMQGVVITFYRLGRIDTHPAIPLGPSGSSKYEDLYPRSRTGLGGLSLSSAGSSRTFRQDLAQNITPLIVDPQALTAIIKTSVQIPDHIFPSISGVPGSMISFKYFIEIVVDLRGKLGQDRLLPKFSMTETPQHTYGDPRVSMVDGKDGVTFSTTPGFNFLITDQIRRQKGVIYTKTEVIVGTIDSNRARGKQKRSSLNGIERHLAILTLHSDDQPVSPTSQHSQNGLRPLHQRDAQHTTFAHVPILLPDQYQEPSDEKSRIRRFEQTLLPSAPPQDPESSTAAVLAASAPYADDEEDFANRYNLQAPAPAYDDPFPISRSQCLRETHINASHHAHSPVVHQGNGDSDGSILRPGSQSGDKQELERQRLQALASSPDDHIDEEDPGRGIVPLQAFQSLPSAPVLSEDDLTEGPCIQARSALESHKAQTLSTDTGPLPDKQEAERLRLQQLASSPDDESVPEAQADVRRAIQPADPSNLAVNDDDNRMVQDGIIREPSHENLPSYKR